MAIRPSQVNGCSADSMSVVFIVEENPSQTNKEVTKPKAKEAQKVQRICLVFGSVHLFLDSESQNPSVMS